MPLQATSGAASYDAFGGGVAAVPNYIEDVFSTYLYTGNGFYPSGGGQTITNGIDLAGKGGLIWIKARSTDTRNGLYDTARGINKMLGSDSTAQEYTDNAMVSANSNGFTLGAESSGWTRINLNGETYASWTFRKQPKFFDVVTYTGNGDSNRDIAHNLGSVPACIIVKETGAANGWAVYHRSLADGEALQLQSTGAKASTNFFGPNSAQTETVFQTGNANKTYTNGADKTYVAYLFAHNAGGFGLTGTDNVISCGSFTTDSGGSASITLGYEPQWMLVKAASTTSNWEIYDNMRGWSVGGDDVGLFANTNVAENPNIDAGRLTATGVLNFTGLTGALNATYIYIAIRRGPMKVPTSGTSVFDAEVYTGNGTAGRAITAGFPVDLAIGMQRTPANGSDRFFVDRLRGATRGLVSWDTFAEATDANSLTNFDSMTGVVVGTDTTDRGFNGSGRSLSPYFFRRAPSFFDVVCYTGTGANRTVAHNLGAVPEMIIVKRRDVAAGWPIYSVTLGASQGMVLQDPSAAFSAPTWWNSTSPTASVFTTGTNAGTNGNGNTFVAYLFATCAGVSKVGSYTGTGTTKQVDCGFTGGARFVLIKRTDSTGDWYVWDSARGIVAGNDPYLLLNSTAAEVTSTDYIDTYSAGFEISSTAPAAINASGGTYIFLAIA